MFMYCCPSCKTIEAHEEKSNIYPCSRCGRNLLSLKVSKATFAAMPTEEKRDLIGMAITAVKEKSQVQKAPQKQSFFEDMLGPNNTPSPSAPNIVENNSPQPNRGKSGVKQIKCEMCGSGELIKDGGVFVCQFCGCKYTIEEARKLMLEGTVDVRGTVKIDNSDYVQKCLQNAHRALNKDDWEEVEKYYNLVEQNSPDNMEAVFFSSFGKAMLSLTDQDYYKRQQKFGVLCKSISIINDCFETTSEDKEDVLNRISDAIAKMYTISYVYNPNAKSGMAGGRGWCVRLHNSVRIAFLKELRQIKAAHPDLDYIQNLINKNMKMASSGCYIATAVYGSYDCPEVWTLRRFRDYKLATKWYGRLFIKSYYAISPTLVDWFGQTDWFKKMWKSKLDRMVKRLQDNGYESTPYKDHIC